MVRAWPFSQPFTVMSRASGTLTVAIWCSGVGTP
jgi:hypothetical protein